MIEASIAKQYGLRIRQCKSSMTWTEFCTLLKGLMPDTPLGQIVTIRAEKDKNVLKHFTSEQKRIHSEWQLKQAKNKLKNEDQLDKEMQQFANSLKTMFGTKKKK